MDGPFAAEQGVHRDIIAVRIDHVRRVVVIDVTAFMPQHIADKRGGHGGNPRIDAGPLAAVGVGDFLDRQPHMTPGKPRGIVVGNVRRLGITHGDNR